MLDSFEDSHSEGGALGLSIACSSGIDDGDDDPLQVDAGIRRVHVAKGSEEETRAHEQNGRGRHLQHDEEAPEREPPANDAAGRGEALQDENRVFAEDAPQRGQAGQQCRDQGRQNRCAQHPRRENTRTRQGKRQLFWRQMGQRPGDRKSDQKPRRRSAEGVDPRLEEEDAEEPATGRPERQVKGGQPPITLGSRHEEARHVQASRQQDERHGDDEQPGELDRFAPTRKVDRQNSRPGFLPCAAGLVGRGDGASGSESRRDAFQFGLRALEGEPALEPPDRVEVCARAIGQPAPRRRVNFNEPREGNPERRGVPRDRGRRTRAARHRRS